MRTLRDSIGGGGVIPYADSAGGAVRVGGKDTTDLKAIYGTAAADGKAQDTANAALTLAGAARDTARLGLARADSVLGGFDLFKAIISTAAHDTVAHNTEEVVKFKTSSFDRLSSYSTTSFHFKPKVTGYYQINAGIRWVTTVDQKLYAGIVKKNGVSVAVSILPSSGTGSLSNVASCLEYLTTSDSIAVYGYQNSGGTALIERAAGNSWFSAKFEGR
jgi:hypothetical protein